MDAEVSKTSGAFARRSLSAKTGGADGEVVWSRYPDADIKPADDASHHAGDGGKKARLTEEITKQAVKTIARGMPGVPAQPW